MNKKRQVPSVVILTSVTTQGLRDMLQGVLRYAQTHGPWNIYQVEKRRWAYQFRNWLRWEPTGIIAADHHSPKEAQRILDANLPTVVLLQAHRMRRPDYPLSSFSCCLWNSKAIGEKAAKYFLDCGYIHFAFANDPVAGCYWSDDREEAFHHRLLQAFADGEGSGFTYSSYGSATMKERADWMNERPRMMRWLRSLPKPCAVFAPNDRRGKQVLDACRAEGVQVPGEIGVLGVDDDIWICEASVPTLSSIRCLAEPAGFAIAEQLDLWMQGKKQAKIEIPVEPVEIITRQSTDWTAVKDVKVAGAIRLIQTLCFNPALSTESIARSLGISRRTLEIRFRQATGRTVRMEIEQGRLSRVKALLQEGKIPLGKIAEASGFTSLTHLDRVFRARFGLPPSHFLRRQDEG